MKLFYIVIGILFFSPWVNGQSRLALKVGPNFSTVNANFNGISQPTGYVPGMQVALQVFTPFEPPLYFSGMISYSRRGYTIQPNVGDIQKYKNTVHSIDLAPMFNYRIKTGETTALVLTGGPLGAFAFSGKETITKNDTTTTRKMQFSISGNYSWIDLAMYGSAGFHFNKFFIEAAWQHGIANINNESEFDNRNIKNRTISLNLGYYLR